MYNLLSDSFLAKYPNQPDHMNELGAFVFYRTYSRWLPTQSRRETWKEAVARAVAYNIGIGVEQFERNRFTPPMDKMRAEAEVLFDNIFNLRQFLSGRTHWVGGADTKVADKFPLANFNCSFINVTKWGDLAELFYLLLVGTGVGFKCTKQMATGLAPVRNNFTLVSEDYKPVPKKDRAEDSYITDVESGVARITVGDSKEGWVNSLNVFLQIITEKTFEHIHTIRICYDHVRPHGERLKTFGGTASGHAPLKEMFEGITDVLKNNIDPNLAPLEPTGEGDYRRVRPIHILDMGNLIGNNVVVGGVRRTAEIFLCDADDWESILAKYGINGIWDSYDDHGQVTKTAAKKHSEVLAALNELGVLDESTDWMTRLKLNDAQARPLNHRRMSNNSVAFTERPSREMLHTLFVIMQNEGEPGFINLEEARRRRPNAEGLNPCAEILLDSYGVCNLTTVNVSAFCIEQEDGTFELDYSGLQQAQALSTRAGIRMTCLDLEIPHWDAVHKRDRLIGTSLTGWKDAMGKLGYDEQQEKNLLSLLSENVHVEGMKYASVLRIPIPLVDTTVKPEGTLSQVAGGVSSGLHVSHAPYFIRRIRINASDSLAKVAQELGWTVHAEVGTAGKMLPHELARPDIIEQARTVVIDFPIKSDSVQTRETQTVDTQFDTYFTFQEDYTAHNSSNTISVREGEWEQAEVRVWEGWDNFVGVSFLAYDGGSFTLAPYEEITEEQYHAAREKMQSFDPAILEQFETIPQEDDADIADPDCSTGACPIR